MFVIGNFLKAIATLTQTLIWLYTLVVIVGAVISWVHADPYNPIVRVIRSLTEPLYYRVRKLLPFVFINGLDLSPLVILLLLQFFNMAVVSSVWQLGARLAL